MMLFCEFAKKKKLEKTNFIDFMFFPLKKKKCINKEFFYIFLDSLIYISNLLFYIDQKF